MKKILVPTDFSLPAKNAALYAMHLASGMRADVKLCNAVMVPVEVPVAAHISTPLMAFDVLEHAAEDGLKQWVKKIEQLNERNFPADVYHPAVESEIGVGPVKEVVSNLAGSQHINLVVMGMSGAGGLSEFLLGGNARELIEKATFPVLLIPSEATFKPIHKIAFATDLSKEDTAVIHVLAGFARTFNAQILIVHIIKDEATDKTELEIGNFLNDITNKVNYHKIYYQRISDKDVDDGLDWLADYGQIQMLAMVHRKHNVLHKLFKGSYTQRLKRHIKIPLMVFPPDCSKKVM